MIISAFPGVGKSHFVKNNDNTLLKVVDHESSEYSWIYVDGQKLRNPVFPTNYVDVAESLSKEGKIVFVSSHDQVRQELASRGIRYTVVVPAIEDKEIYVNRYIQRGTPLELINLIATNWESFINSCMNDTTANIVVVRGDTYLSNVLSSIVK